MSTFLAVFAVNARVVWSDFPLDVLTVTGSNDEIVEFRSPTGLVFCTPWPELLRALFTGQLKPAP